MKNRLILTFIFTFLIFISRSYCDEISSGILYGFIDNDYYNESGAILLDVNSILLKNIDREFSSVSRKKTKMGIEYAEIPFAKVVDSFPMFMKQSFQLYSEKGYLGDFKIEKMVNVSYAESMEVLGLFAKLNAIKHTTKQISVIAKAKSGSTQNPPGKVFQPVKLAGPDRLKIEKILNDKLKEAKKKLFDPQFGFAEKQNGRPFQFILEYQVFVVQSSNKQNPTLFINAVWECTERYLLGLETAYHFINTFSLRDNQIIELEPIKATFDNQIEVPSVLWGIDLDINDNLQWVIDYKLWEGSVTQIVKWDGSNRKVLYPGIYMGQ